jgi:hypothetical protein
VTFDSDGEPLAVTEELYGSDGSFESEEPLVTDGFEFTGERIAFRLQSDPSSGSEAVLS